MRVVANGGESEGLWEMGEEGRVVENGGGGLWWFGGKGLVGCGREGCEDRIGEGQEVVGRVEIDQNGYRERVGGIVGRM